jgi:hypothetical protein
MKKILSTIAILAVASAGFAQGFVSLGNGTGTLFSTNGFAAGEPASTTAYYFDVLVQSWTGSIVAATGTNAVTTGNWLDTGVVTPNIQTGQPGKVNTASGAQAANWAVGVTNEFIIVGWTANLGATWALAEANLASGLFGQTLPSFEASGAAAPGTPSVLWGPSSTGPQTYGNPIATGLNLAPIPEPTTLALAGLGSLSLLLFRRRK